MKDSNAGRDRSGIQQAEQDGRLSDKQTCPSLPAEKPLFTANVKYLKVLRDENKRLRREVARMKDMIRYVADRLDDISDDLCEDPEIKMFTKIADEWEKS